MKQARIEHAPNGGLLTYITSADALVNEMKCLSLSGRVPSNHVPHCINIVSLQGVVVTNVQDNRYAQHVAQILCVIAVPAYK